MMCSDVHMYGSLLILYGSDDHCLSLRSISIPFCLLSLVRNVFNFLSNTVLYWTIFAWNRDTAVPVEGNGDLQTLICVVTARPRWCSTLSKLSSEKTDWQLIPATLHRWRCCFLADQLRSMARIWKKESAAPLRSLLHHFKMSVHLLAGLPGRRSPSTIQNINILSKWLLRILQMCLSSFTVHISAAQSRKKWLLLAVRS